MTVGGYEAPGESGLRLGRQWILESILNNTFFFLLCGRCAASRWLTHDRYGREYAGRRYKKDIGKLGWNV